MTASNHALTLFENPAPRCPVMLLLDNSASMRGEPIRALNRGVQRFYEEVYGDEVSRFSVESSIITFGAGGVRKRMNFTSCVQPVEPPRLEADSSTPLGEALSLGLHELTERRAFYKRSGISSYKPWMIVMSDGMPNDAWQDPARRAVDLSDQGKLVYLGVGVGTGVDWNLFQQIMPANRAPKALDGLKFSEFFEWLADSLRSVSQSSPGQSVPLPPTDGWEAV